MNGRIRWLKVHAGWAWQDARLLAQRSIQEFFDDRCTQIAASISYYVFFSIFPLTIFLVTAFGQLLRNETFKERVIDAMMEVVPLEPVEGREQLEEILSGVSTELSLLGLFSIIGLLWSASAMMGALRVGLNIAWDSNYRRPVLRGKLTDIVMILIVGLLVLLSVAATGLRPFIRDAIDDVSAHYSVAGSVLEAALWLATYLVPIAVSFLIFTALYRFIPAVKTSFNEIWPGALFAAVAFELTKVGFAFYIANFGNYNAIYGSLGAVIVFMLFIFIAANILLFGAEMASEWPRVLAGHYDSGVPQRQAEEPIPFRDQVRLLLRQALLGPESPPEHVDDEEIEERSRQRAEARARQLARLRDAERRPPH